MPCHAQVVSGGENLLDKVDDLKKRSEDLKRQGEIAKRQEEEMRRRQQEIEMQHMDANAKYASLEEEVQVKGRQLKKLFEKYQSKKAEMVRACVHVRAYARSPLCMHVCMQWARWSKVCAI